MDNSPGKILAAFRRSLFRRPLCSIALIAIFAAVNSNLPADEQADGRRALAESAKYPWYDAQSDALRQVPLDAPSDAEPVSPDKKRKAKPKKTKASGGNTGGGGGGGGGMTGGGSFSLVSGLFWVLIVLGLIALVGILVWAFLRREQNDESGLESMLDRQRLKSDEERIENLPFQVRKGNGSLHDRARAAYEAGNYREAMIFLYSHMLLQMDRKQWIRLQRARTNRQYLREIRNNVTLKRIFRNAMLKFESTFFGAHALERDSFEDCWQAMEEFDKSLEIQAGDSR